MVAGLQKQQSKAQWTSALRHDSLCPINQRKSHSQRKLLNQDQGQCRKRSHKGMGHREHDYRGLLIKQTTTGRNTGKESK